jgi:ABC-type lipoprotein export system ATPase subunit
MVTHDPKAAEYAGVTLNLDKGNLVAAETASHHPVPMLA